MHATLGVEVLVLNHAKPAAVFAASSKVLYLDLQSSDAVAFTFVFFSHYTRTTFLLKSLLGDKHTGIITPSPHQPLPTGRLCRRLEV